MRKMKAFSFTRKKFGCTCYLAAELRLEVTLPGRARGIVMKEVFILDTGSGLTLLRGSVLAANGIRYDDLVRPKDGATIGGYAWKSKPYMLNVYFPDVGLPDFAVFVDPCRDAQEPEFSLLGWNFIDNFCFNFSPDLQKVMFKPWNQGLFGENRMT